MIMTNEERIKRLNATLYLASTVPAHRLDQGGWTTTGVDRAQRYGGGCQTAHCIAGWCGASPWHQNLGYELDGAGLPRYHNLPCIMSFAHFHGIAYEEAKEVTLDNSTLLGEAARRDVMRKLKALIRRYGGKVVYS